jgi:hypothetical protein
LLSDEGASIFSSFVASFGKPLVIMSVEVADYERVSKAKKSAEARKVCSWMTRRRWGDVYVENVKALAIQINLDALVLQDGITRSDKFGGVQINISNGFVNQEGETTPSLVTGTVSRYDGEIR